MFLVIPNPSEIIILGMKFLMDNDAVINLKDGTMNLDGIEYEICRGSKTNNQHDSEIINKSRIYTIKDRISNLLQSAMKNNPLIGNINVITHTIDLSREFTNIAKEYPVPIGLRDEVREHLKILIEKDIIEESNCKVYSPAFIIKKKNGRLGLWRTTDD
ncbi:hypothetical protein DMUE_0497 [Dictyocoela muelleri]|nr:hypothetical protein DMUE_0497 [Dictyocoela muelleri]